MSGDRLLLVDGDAAHLPGVAAVLRDAAVVETAGCLDDVPANGAYDLVVANYDALGPEGAGRLLQRYPELRGHGRVLLFTAGVDRAALASLFGEYGLSNVLARNGAVDGHDLLVTVQKILRGDVFGVDKYFAADSARRETQVRSSEERERVLEDARAFALSIGAQNRFADLLCNACDELLTNALYNAPVDATGKPRFAQQSRATPVCVDAGEEAVVTLACDGKRMGISVADRFGSLQAGTITHYLAKCLRRGTDQVDEKEGGAGLGLFYVFEAVSHFVVNIERGRRTEMIGLLDIRGRYKDFVQRPKSFNVFVADPRSSP